MMKKNRVMLKLVNIGDVFASKNDVYEMYFAPCPAINDPHTRYDKEIRCYYFKTMEEAIEARDFLKSHFKLLINRGKFSGSIPLYDVMSEMIPWYDCEMDRKRMKSCIDGGSGQEKSFVVIPEEMSGIENLIAELEKEALGDDDGDSFTGAVAIAMAEAGIGRLIHKTERGLVVVSVEAAKEIVKTDPNSITIEFIADDGIPF